MPRTYRRAARDAARPPSRRALPPFFPPMMAQRVNALPDDKHWLYELKFDGYRALLFKGGTDVRLRSRNDKDLSLMYPAVVSAGQRLRADQAIVDGEIIAVDAIGRPSFQALQHRRAHPKHTTAFVAFDLPFLDGANWMRVPLEARRTELLRGVADSGVMFSQSLPGTAADVIRAVKEFGLEGVIAKRKGSIYVPGERTSDWLKLKLEKSQEFVIGGYRPESSSIDALLVGYYEGGKLRFAGKVRAGFVPRVRRELLRKLAPLRAARCPFADLPSGSSRWGGGVTAEEMHEMQWVRPTLVAQIQFVEWTQEGRLRHARFLGLRGDKIPREVHRESSI